ncbi:MAG: peptide deformylase [Candidatus Paceibacterota bacterium]|jgi:peptide deformylase
MKEIVQDGAEVLREIAKPLPEELFGSTELTNLIADMSEALDKKPEGVALAAPQVGVSWRLFIVRKDRTLPPPPNTQGSTLAQNSQGQTLETKPEIEVYINPEIIKTSRKKARMDEGCLSTDGVFGVTNRHERVTVKARRPDGSQFERGGGGLMAQIFEHEIDHLNGILFIDHAKNLIQVAHDHEPAT